jgi:integrase
VGVAAPPGLIQLAGKGNKEREIWRHDDATGYVNDWLKVLGSGRGPISAASTSGTTSAPKALPGRSLGRIIDARRRAAGVDPLTTHDFRRTMVSDLLENGTDLVTAQHAAGHASPPTTGASRRRPGLFPT